MELHDAIKATVDKFGKDVLVEERFVNILADVYPHRDNPALLGIIRTLVKEGYCSDLLSCDKDSVQVFISKTTLALNKKNGYDKKLVEDILNSLAIGSGIVSLKVKVGTVPTKPAQLSKPSRKTTQKPASPQKQGSSKPVKQKTPKPIQKQNNKTDDAFSDYFLGAAVPMIGLIVSMIVYYLTYLSKGWWLFPTLIINAVIYLVTILFMGIDIRRPIIVGIYCAVVIMTIILSISSLFWIILDDFCNFYSFRLEEYSIFSGILALLICFALGAFLNLEFLDNIDVRQKVLKTKAFIKSFLFTIIPLLFVYQLFLFMPYYSISFYKISNAIIQLSRNNDEIELSFIGIRLGSRMSDLSNSFKDNKTILPTNKNSLQLRYLDSKYVNYFELMDSALLVKSTWNNKPVEIRAYSYNDTIRILQIEAHTRDRLVAMYESKYGKAGTLPHNEKYYHSYEKVWEFKNGTIIINGSDIYYIDNKCEELSNEKKEKEKRLMIEKQNRQKKKLEQIKEMERKQDSINEIKERERRKVQELQEREAIKQI